MRKFKFYILSLVVAATLVGATSCSKFLDNDGADSRTLVFTFGELQRDASRVAYFMQDDSTTVVPLSAINVADSLIGKRFYMEGYIEKTNANPAFDNTMDVQLISGVIDKSLYFLQSGESIDDYGKKSIIYSNAVQTGKYLNFFFRFYGTDSNLHTFTLVYSTRNTAMTNDVIYLELRHKASQDVESTGYSSVASYDISSLIDAHEGDFKVSVAYTEVGNTTPSTKEYKISKNMY